MEETKEELARKMALLYAAWKELKGNGMLSGSDVVRNGKGVSANSPIVIHATEDYYVRLEYIILSLLLRCFRVLSDHNQPVFPGAGEGDQVQDESRQAESAQDRAEQIAGLLFFLQPDGLHFVADIRDHKTVDQGNQGKDCKQDVQFV